MTNYYNILSFKWVGISEEMVNIDNFDYGRLLDIFLKKIFTF